MRELFDWFTHMENTKPLALVMLFVTFIGIILYVYSSRKRSARLETYKYIPFDDEPGSSANKQAGNTHEH